METLGLAALLFLLGWQVLAMRREIAALSHSTTIFYAVESEAKGSSGVEAGSVSFRKQFSLPIAVVPGMEFAGIANNVPTPIVRVVFDSEGRGIHLKTGSAPVNELEEIAKWYVSRGWVRDV